MPTTTKLDERLREIAAALTSEIAKIICAMTVDELLALSSVRDDRAVEVRAKKTRPAAKGRPKTPRKPRPAPKPKVKTRRKARPAPKPEAEAAVTTESTASTEPPPQPPPPPTPARILPPPEDRAAAFLRSERERLESAVLKFVESNPETDAEIVSQRVGLQKGKAQEVLDDLVLRGRLRMKSGQHGRCYVVVEQG